jgi:hypothetical protein
MKTIQFSDGTKVPVCDGEGVGGRRSSTILPTRVHHRYLELCVISQAAFFSSPAKCIVIASRAHSLVFDLTRPEFSSS